MHGLLYGHYLDLESAISAVFASLDGDDDDDYDHDDDVKNDDDKRG